MSCCPGWHWWCFRRFWLPIAIALRLTGEGEVFFVQQRVGLGGKAFGLYKFATMLKNSPSIGTGTVTVKHDPRVLPLGRFLRKTKINELPQLLNIFKGDMSIIGPRPQTQRCFDAFPIASQMEIVKVRPGLSGIGSIVFRDEEELMHASAEPERFYDDVIMPYKGLLEEWYVAHQGLVTYILCIFATAWVVLFPTSRIVWSLFADLPKQPTVLVIGGLSPLLVPIAIALRLTGEGEVFFVQQRVGLGGRAFGLYKFATMLKNSPSIGTGTVTVKHDPRVLPLGRFLRKTKINELPQLLNIFKGDMSIIGPRPQTQRCFDAFPIASQVEIVKVRPGLSGIGSIVFRDEEELMHASAEPERFYDDVIMPYKGGGRVVCAHQGWLPLLCIFAPLGGGHAEHGSPCRPVRGDSL